MRNKNGEYWVQEENQLVWSSLSFHHTHPWTGTFISQSSHSQRMMRFVPKSVGEGRAAWESHVPLWGHASAYHRLRRSPLSFAETPVPCTTLFPLTKTRTESVICLSSMLQMFTGILTNTSTRHLSQETVYTFFNFWAFKHSIKSEIPTTSSEHASEGEEWAHA